MVWIVKGCSETGYAIDDSTNPSNLPVLHMGSSPTRQERRIKERRGIRTGIKFPLTDGRDCLVLYDRSRVADRRLENSASGALPAGARSANPAQSSGRARVFRIAGELIASVNSIYHSGSTDSWKELELYRIPNGQYVCLEIWRTTMDGKHDQYWLTTCDDLKSVHDFFGNSSLARELFDNVL